MKIIVSATAVIPIILGLAGCVSLVSVVKAKPDTPGIHYFLPQPFVQVTPNKDGTVVVEVIYLPDPDNEYSIQASSFLGNYTIDVNRNEKGFLETVSFNADSTGVAKQLIQSGSNLRAAEIDAKAEKAKSDAADAKDAGEKATEALAAAKKAQKEAQTAVDIAQSKLDFLVTAASQANPPANIADQIFSAKLALSEAVVKRDAASVNYNAVVENPAAANAVANGPFKAPEPVFLRVDMTADLVTLVQDFVQSDRETWVAPKADSVSTELTVLPATLVVRPGERNNALTATVKADRELLSVAFVDVDPPLEGTDKNPIFALRADKTTIDIEFPKETEGGDYNVDGTFVTGTKDNPSKWTRSFFVRIEQ